jgi:3D (Asp-Asp-Asp) domain-containing protein
MSNKMRRANLRCMRIFRTLAIILGFWCTIHFAHRECARVAGKPLKNIKLQSSNVDSTSNVSPATAEFEATAYCVTGISKSGIRIAPGHVAADPKVIPLGSMIYVDSPLMSGIYQVLDTGELVKGNIIDIFIPSYERCKEFGRRAVKVQVLRYGFLGYGPDPKPDK